MPYRKRYRAPRRKRAFRKRSRKRISRKKYDTRVHRKCFLEASVIYNTAVFNGTVSVHFGSASAGVPPNPNLQHTDSLEFDNFKALFREYRLMGVKIKFVPAAMNGLALASFNGTYMTSPTYVPVQTTTDAEFMKNDFFKQFQTNRPFQRYINLAKFWNSRDVKWIETSATYPDAGAAVRLQGINYGNGDFMGKVYATYYVAFRGAK